jgi:cysteine sulfinate desulfinase/cysteine desulfurase-like protein
MSAEAADESIRFSLSRFTTAKEIRRATSTIAGAVDYVRNATGMRVA